MRNTPTTNACLFLMRDRGLYVGPGFVRALHAVHGLTVYVAIAGTIAIRGAADRTWRDASAMLVPPDLPHEVDASRGLAAELLLVPETARARHVLALYGASRISGLPDAIAGRFRPRLLSVLETGGPNEAAAEVCEDFFASIAPGRPAAPGVDVRIERLLNYVHTSGELRLPVPALAAVVGLSPDRLSHLFRCETGTSLDRYFVWRRLRAALDEMATAQTLTESAHRAGFADAAHLSRVFHRTFGTPPSTLFGSTRVLFTNL